MAFEFLLTGTQRTRICPRGAGAALNE